MIPAKLTAAAPRFLLRLPILRRLIASVPSITAVAEIGPGRGDLAAVLLDDNLGIRNFDLHELSGTGASILGKRFEHNARVRVIEGDFFSGKHSNYDLVICCEVLEHLENDIAAIKAVHHSLAPGGHILLSVPAYKRKWQAVDKYAGHVRRYEKDELLRLLHAAGFDVLDCRNYGFPLTALMYPMRELYYRRINARSHLSPMEATIRSGTDRPSVPRWMIAAVYACCQPFVWMQRAFESASNGDGLVVLAGKRQGPSA